MTMTAVAEAPRERIPGQVLTFVLATEHYGVDILRVSHGPRNLQALFRRRAEID